MNTKAPYWQMIYAHDRREHRHRCRRCNRIIEAGESVYMAKVASKTTWTLHDSCAQQEFSGHTWLAYMEHWGMAYLAKCGSERAPL